jgi:glyoxylase-like metal-dependent hydrolase (beta-lactamase superfamily II)
MRILPVKGYQNVYTSNVYFLLGEWKRIEDVHTLIDVGNDPSLLTVLESINTGVGKNKVDQVILTHNHSDHSGILPQIRDRYHPKVCSFSRFANGVDHVLRNGQKIRVGETELEVIHTPGHTNDSICLLNEAAGVLFTGDAQLTALSLDGTYEPGFCEALKTLSNRKIHTLYPGHGKPLAGDMSALIYDSWRRTRDSRRAIDSEDSVREEIAQSQPFYYALDK